MEDVSGIIIVLLCVIEFARWKKAPPKAHTGRKDGGACVGRALWFVCECKSVFSYVVPLVYLFGVVCWLVSLWTGSKVVAEKKLESVFFSRFLRGVIVSSQHRRAQTYAVSDGIRETSSCPNRAKESEL